MSHAHPLPLSREDAVTTHRSEATVLVAQAERPVFEVSGAMARDVLSRARPDSVAVHVIPRDDAAERALRDIGLRPLPARTMRPAAEAFCPGARARALLRGKSFVQEDLRETGGTYSLQEVQVMLNGVSRQRVQDRVKEGSLLAVPGPSNRRHYPVVQFDAQGRVVPGLREVQAALPTRDPWAVLNFLARPEARLDGRRPIELLREGQVAPVVEAAKRMAQQGA